jgi:hypothetical protein
MSKNMYPRLKLGNIKWKQDYFEHLKEDNTDSRYV